MIILPRFIKIIRHVSQEWNVMLSLFHLNVHFLDFTKCLTTFLVVALCQFWDIQPTLFFFRFNFQRVYRSIFPLTIHQQLITTIILFILIFNTNQVVCVVILGDQFFPTVNLFGGSDVSKLLLRRFFGLSLIIFNGISSIFNFHISVSS